MRLAGNLSLGSSPNEFSGVSSFCFSGASDRIAKAASMYLLCSTPVVLPSAVIASYALSTLVRKSSTSTKNGGFFSATISNDGANLTACRSYVTGFVLYFLRILSLLRRTSSGSAGKALVMRAISSFENSKVPSTIGFPSCISSCISSQRSSSSIWASWLSWVNASSKAVFPLSFFPTSAAISPTTTGPESWMHLKPWTRNSRSRIMRRIFHCFTEPSSHLSGSCDWLCKGEWRGLVWAAGGEIHGGTGGVWGRGGSRGREEPTFFARGGSVRGKAHRQRSKQCRAVGELTT